MKKATRSSSAGDVNVTIARLGEDNVEVAILKDSTIGDVIEESGIELSSSERLFVNSEEAKEHYVVDEGDHIAIIGKKEGGSEEDDE